MPKISGVVRWLKAEKRKETRWPARTWSMSCGCDAGLDDEAVRLRHDQHDRLARVDDAADRMHRELVHEAVLRGADVDALELVLGRHLALDELADLGLAVAQFGRHLALEVLDELDDLQLGLSDLALGAGDRGDELALLAIEPRGLALQGGEARDRHEVLLVELLHSLEFLIDEAVCLRLAAACASSPRISSRNWATRSVSWARWPSIAVRRASNRLRSPAMTSATSGLSFLAIRPSGNLMAVQAVALGDQPRLPRLELVELLCDHRRGWPASRSRPAA